MIQQVLQSTPKACNTMLFYMLHNNLSATSENHALFFFAKNTAGDGVKHIMGA